MLAAMMVDQWVFQYQDWMIPVIDKCENQTSKSSTNLDLPKSLRIITKIIWNDFLPLFADDTTLW